MKKITFINNIAKLAKLFKMPKAPKMFLGSLLVLLSLTLISSCKKSFLDQHQNPKIVQVSGPDCQAILNNYQNMNASYPYDGEVGSDDYFSPFENSSSNGDEDRIYRWDSNSEREPGSDAWSSPYQLIYYANVVLETIDQNPGGLDDTSINTLKGEALFFRANMFYQLAQLYTIPYDASTASKDLGIPTRTSPDVAVPSVRGTVETTFTQIVADLQQAVTLLPLHSSIASVPNRASAYAALARTYLTLQDFKDAGACANASLQIDSVLMDYNTLNQASSVPFSRFNSEVLFQSVLDPGSIDRPQNSSYVDTDLYAMYTKNDLRKSLFFKSNSTGNYFTGNYQQVGNAGFFCGYATDEEFLTSAECYARAGNTNAAMARLNSLLKTRWVTGTFISYTASTSDDALAQILTERRKELCFRGIRWADLRRLNKDPRFAKTLTRGSFTDTKSTFTLPPNDPRYALLLPYDALLNNTLQQNPR